MLKIFLVSLLLAVISSIAFADSATLEAQKKLTSKGYDVGVVDGIMGTQTHAAIMKFQKDSAITPTGKLDEVTKQELGIVSQKKQGSVQYFVPTQKSGHTTAIQIPSPTMKCPQCEVMVNGKWQCKSRVQVKNYPGAPAMCR